MPIALTPSHSHLLSLSQTPTVMSRINIPPAIMAEVKEVMASTNEKILQPGSAECGVFVAVVSSLLSI